MRIRRMKRFWDLESDWVQGMMSTELSSALNDVGREMSLEDLPFVMAMGELDGMVWLLNMGVSAYGYWTALFECFAGLAELMSAVSLEQ